MAGPRPAPPVLIVWEHGGQLGHLARLLPVALALRARGVSVVLAVAQPSTVVPFFAPLDVTVMQAPRVATQASSTDTALCPADIWLRCGFAHPPSAQACVLEWLALFDALAPQVVLVDASPMALYATQVAGLSAVAMGHGFELPPPDAGVCFAPWHDDWAAQVAHSGRVLHSALFSLGEGLQTQAGGRTLGTSVAQVLGSAQAALCTWPQLDHFERRCLPQTRDQTVNSGPVCLGPVYLGPIWHELTTTRSLDWPERLGAKVLCYLTLTDQRHDLLWQALQSLGANVLVVTPAGQEWACKQARGWSITVCTETVTLQPLLHQADAVVGHGGMGLTSMALHAGKPLLLLPNQLEQGLLAYQLTRRGLAISSLNHLDKTQIRARAHQLLHDTGLKERVSRFAQTVEAYQPEDAVSRVVQRLLGQADNAIPFETRNLKELSLC